jgi:hypothetical protein
MVQTAHSADVAVRLSMNVAEKLAHEISRVTTLRAQYASLDGMPQSMRPVMFLMDRTLQCAKAAVAVEDQIVALKNLEEFTEGALSYLYNFHGVDYPAGSRPRISRCNIDGPMLVYRDGQIHWLTPWERFCCWIGIDDAERIERRRRPDLFASSISAAELDVGELIGRSLAGSVIELGPRPTSRSDAPSETTGAKQISATHKAAP